METADGSAWVLVSLGNEDLLTFFEVLPFGSLRFRFWTTAEGEDCEVWVEDFACDDLLVGLETLEVAGGFTSEPVSTGKLVSDSTRSATSLF